MHLFHLRSIINPGISLVYNALGPNIAPNMVTNIVFDWRGLWYLGEALILVTESTCCIVNIWKRKLKGDEEWVMMEVLLLKLLVLPISIILICLGVNTILGGHITPGGGF